MYVYYKVIKLLEMQMLAFSSFFLIFVQKMTKNLVISITTTLFTILKDKF